MTDTHEYASLQGRLTYASGDTFHINAPRVKIIEGPMPEGQKEFHIFGDDEGPILLPLQTPQYVDLRMEAAPSTEPGTRGVIYGVTNKPHYDHFLEALAKMMWDPTPENINDACAHLAVEDWRELEAVTKALKEKIS